MLASQQLSRVAGAYTTQWQWMGSYMPNNMRTTWDLVHTHTTSCRNLHTHCTCYLYLPSTAGRCQLNGLQFMHVFILIGKTGCVWSVSLQEVEDEQHFLFECPAYSHIRAKHADLLQQIFTVPDFFARIEPNACGAFLRECSSCRNSILNEWIHTNWTLSVGPQDIKQIHRYIHTSCS